MKSLNNFSDNESDQWEVMQEFKILFKDELLTVQLVCIYHPAPELYFFVSDPPHKRTLMKRKLLPPDKIIWLSNWNMEDAAELTDIIAEQTGIVLPLNETNNPFEYNGDITVDYYCAIINDIKVIKAKAPYGNNIYYKIFLDGTISELVRIKTIQGLSEDSWIPGDNTFLQFEELNILKSLVETFEQYNQWRQL
ncbi:hypothetical protein ESA94_18200 [Lacibacter luteus]|uniref:Uncharacterized protein n=1 Tax=Lacibacter luteus TaxID=2508719 RepID=A0A4Q1CF80_9BACT|nr:hypothetical protein [Lacibacter luteus]RXK58564.1 hypothetical protein ESA94_18200 [Lacibacter luteus]